MPGHDLKDLQYMYDNGFITHEEYALARLSLPGSDSYRRQLLECVLVEDPSGYSDAQIARRWHELQVVLTYPV